MRRKRVLIAGLYHETHTFVPGRTTRSDFTRLQGQELWQAVGEPSPLGGAMDTARELDWDIVPAMDYRARPSGTVAADVIEVWWDEFRQAAQIALEEQPLDGLFLILHGAMVTEDCRDVEGELLERIRSIPGFAEIPLGGVTDLHANVSARMARFSSALITYRQNPHTDSRETAVRAAHILDRLMQTGRTARTLWRQPPLVLPPTATATNDEPMRTLEALARQMETAEPALLAVNVHAGFAFADTPDTGVSFTINTLEDEAAAERLLETLCRAAMQPPLHGGMEEMSVETAMEYLTQYDTGPILLIEPSDNIGAGAPGEGISLLKAFIAHNIRDAGVIINDPEAVSVLSTALLGDRRSLRIGGKSSPLYEGPCELEVEFLSRSDGRFTLEDPHSHLASMLGSQVDMGPCTVVRHQGVVILLTTQATPPFDLGQWRSQGIPPELLFAIGVKAAVAHRQAYDPIARASLYVQTPGPCCTDLRLLPFRYLRRPVRPLDFIADVLQKEKRMDETRETYLLSAETPLPDFLTTNVSLNSGERITFRPLSAEDAGRFGDYLQNLSEATRARYGPHPFDRATAEAICAALNPADILRMTATVSQNGTETIIAYFLLKPGLLENDRLRYENLGIPLDSETDCTLAPSVADDYQNQGVGSLLMRHVLQSARRLGRTRVVLWGGVQASNERGVHFYTKFGFRKVGEFYTDKNNFDMILDLREGNL